MERIKTPKLVITFPTTTAAMAMEDAFDAQQGRLIPIPQEISGGCGLAWCADPALEQELLARMTEKGISFQEKRIIALYGFGGAAKCADATAGNSSNNGADFPV